MVRAGQDHGGQAGAGAGAVTEDRARLHTAVLVAPSKERRKLRKQRRKAEADSTPSSEGPRSPPRRRRPRRSVPSAARRSTCRRPARAWRSGSARTPGRFRSDAASGHVGDAGGRVPFVAEGGLGADGVFVGQDLYSGGSFVYDPWVLYARGIITAPNVVLAGDRRFRQVIAGEVPLHAVAAVRAARVRARRPEGRTHRRRQRRRQTPPSSSATASTLA